MTDSRKKHGFIGIANQIWDEVIRRDFTKRQKDILMFLWRMSYGCNRDVAIIPKQKDFSICGVGENKAGEELKHLEACRVIFRNGKEYRFNEEFDFWQISPVKGWDGERFKELVHLNIGVVKKCKPVNEEKSSERIKILRRNLPKTGIFSRKKTSQNGKAEIPPNFPKREENQLEFFPKREVEGVSNPSGAQDTAALNTSFKDIKDINIVEIVNYLNEKTNGKFSPKTKETTKLIGGRLSEGRTVEEFKQVIDCKAKEWMGTKQEQYLRPSTLFRPSNFESYLSQSLKTKTKISSGGGRADEDQFFIPPEPPPM